MVCVRSNKFKGLIYTLPVLLKIIECKNTIFVMVMYNFNSIVLCKIFKDFPSGDFFTELNITWL